MRLKHLEASLSCLQRDFNEPKIDLEQYPTCPELAAAVVDAAVKRGDIGNPGQDCLDLGCGTAMLTVAAAFVVAEGEFVWGVDCDEDALQIARDNVDLVDLDDCVKFLQAEVRMKGNRDESDNIGDGVDKKNQHHKIRQKQRGGRGCGRGRGRGRAFNAGSLTKSRLIYDREDGIPLPDNYVETVLTNPPFGTKTNAGIDVQFLRTATRLARRAVYSFHKRSTRDFLLKMIREDWGFPESEVVAEMKFDIPNSYKFHKCKTKDVEVDLIRICMVNHDNVGVGVGDNGDIIGEGRDCYGDADGGNLEDDDDENYKTHTQEGGNSNNIDEPK